MEDSNTIEPVELNEFTEEERRALGILSDKEKASRLLKLLAWIPLLLVSPYVLFNAVFAFWDRGNKESCPDCGWRHDGPCS